MKFFCFLLPVKDSINLCTLYSIYNYMYNTCISVLDYKIYHSRPQLNKHTYTCILIIIIGTGMFERSLIILIRFVILVCLKFPFFINFNSTRN